MAAHVGVDWGSNGWVCARWDDKDQWEASVLPSFLDVWHTYKDADQILVDIPIGLPNDGHRDCDAEAKEILSYAPQRVFWTPPREALEYDSYEAAKKETDTSMTTQAWSILPRIREVDTFFTEHDVAKGKVREAHPEICFAKLGDGEHGSTSKQSDVGTEERLAILDEFEEYSVGDEFDQLVENHITDLPPWGRRFRSSNEDDLLDAMGLAVMSSIADGNLQFLPTGRENAPKDEKRNVPMEIVFYDS